MQFLYLNSNKLGLGDDKLGEELLISYLQAIVLNETKIDFVFCVNSGAFLTTTNQAAINLLKRLEENGATVVTCGTCLDYYNIKEQLEVGDVGSMALAIQVMQKAKTIYRP